MEDAEKDTRARGDIATQDITDQLAALNLETPASALTPAQSKEREAHIKAVQWNESLRAFS